MGKLKGLLTFFAGAATAAAAVSMTAPHTGRYNRARMRTRVEREKEKADDRIQQYQQLAHDFSKRLNSINSSGQKSSNS